MLRKYDIKICLRGVKIKDINIYVSG